MNLIYLTILFPLLGFLLLSCFCDTWKPKFISCIGIGSVVLSGLVTIYIAWIYLNDIYLISSLHFNISKVYTQFLWVWMSVDNFCIPISFTIDGLSLIMLSIIVGVGLLVHLYSSWYMRGEKDYSRFFAYMNLFIANMIILVLADNLLLMYLGWEGVGLCSYLLIGFYYTDINNGLSALKAFIVTRISDVILAFGLFILYDQLGTLNFNDLSKISLQDINDNFNYINLAIFMLFGGAIGKSVQVPLHIWLVDAMAAPAPVSALIHAATMVTSGIYLICRTHNLFLMFSNVLDVISIIGLLTLIIFSLLALFQDDLKRILAYSTISQLGYMFLSIGVHAWHSAMFHLMVHAFFKALLFLAAGSLVIGCSNENKYNIFKVGVKYKNIPLIYSCFLAGGLSLSSFPLITSGFYSKESILCNIVFFYGYYSIFTIVGLIGSFLTSLYTFRMIFILFHRDVTVDRYKYANFNWVHNISLFILFILSTAIGSWIRLPLSGILPYDLCCSSDFLNFKIFSSMVILLGVFFAIIFWLIPNRFFYVIYHNMIERYCLKLFYNFDVFDWFYKNVFVRLYLFIVRILVNDPLNIMMDSFGLFFRFIGYFLMFIENGRLQWYMLLMSGGLFIFMVFLMFF